MQCTACGRITDDIDCGVCFNCFDLIEDDTDEELLGERGVLSLSREEIEKLDREYRQLNATGNS